MAQPHIGFVFPGQGSQKIGMLADIAKQHEFLLETFDQASEQLGYDLWDLSQYGTEEEISQTEITQPLLLTASVAVWRLWKHLGGPMPSAVAGHSLGEWSALVCADVVDLNDAVQLVRKRGQYMQTAVPVGKGAMSAIIGLDDDKIIEACASSASSGVVSAVNFNAPGQVVIAGEKEAVGRASIACKEAGAKRALPLPVSAPFHTSLMQLAADNLADDIKEIEFRAPKLRILHNVTIDSEQDPSAIKDLMIQQITAPVPWVATVQKLSALGATTLLECGPGRVLSGLNRRIQRDLISLNTDTLEAFDNALESAQ